MTGGGGRVPPDGGGIIPSGGPCTGAGTGDGFGKAGAAAIAPETGPVAIPKITATQVNRASLLVACQVCFMVRLLIRRHMFLSGHLAMAGDSVAARR
ncbi:hypothetical protein GV829_05805 [Sphingomonas lacunae]|uniref:Uncharacterized protein n=1 Tax=Sphingomonas lacunae TaxID=2698828 RepID=A0A6M4AVE4_9SPHN|nr:hypothetical protein [Sphingomonas lacunae]QJQ32029.1 hypothetical protein GV829_05805 [Sphingomonas lacunae]